MDEGESDVVSLPNVVQLGQQTGVLEGTRLLQQNFDRVEMIVVVLDRPFVDQRVLLQVQFQLRFAFQELRIF